MFHLLTFIGIVVFADCVVTCVFANETSIEYVVATDQLAERIVRGAIFDSVGVAEGETIKHEVNQYGLKQGDVCEELFEGSKEVGERVGLVEVRELVPCAAPVVTLSVPIVTVATAVYGRFCYSEEDNKPEIAKMLVPATRDRCEPIESWT